MFVQVKDFPDYLIFDNGTVVSLKGGVWREMRLNPDSRGYLSISFSKNGKHTTKMAHSLVAAAFLGRRPEGFDIDHINGIKTDNRAENLEYVTREKNIQRAWANGLFEAARKATRESNQKRQGEKNPMAKLSNLQAAEILALRDSGFSQRKIAKQFNIGKTTVDDIWSGKRQTHIQAGATA